ncbi:MAG: ABC transporter permease subunit [Thermoanaerobaculia bacterium]
MDRSLSPTLQEARTRATAERFSLRRLGLVAGLDLKEDLRRPLFVIFALVMLINGYWQSRGNWILRSIDTSLGTPKSWVDSEFQTAYIYALISFYLVGFFVAVGAGMPLIRDAEAKIVDLLHTTPLRPAEYVWGKFLAALSAIFLAVLVLPVSTGILSHFAPDPGLLEGYGPFVLRAYVMPFLVFLLPAMVFTAGAAFAIGRWTGKPILVFLFPVMAFLLCNNWLWRVYPPNMREGLSDVLRYIDPTGFRWMKESWLLVDRGLAFYNTRPIEYDGAFLLSRLGFIAAGLLLVDLSRRHFTHRLRRPVQSKQREAFAGTSPAAEPRALAAMGMATRVAGAVRQGLDIARFELQELRSQPGLYIFIPFILLFQYTMFRDAAGGEFADAQLLTPGTAAQLSLPFYTLAFGLLFLFYTVESLERERTSGTAPVLYATPVPTGSIVAGKILANLGVLAIALVGGIVTAAIALAVQGQVAFQLKPFLIVYGLLLVPTMIVWMTFVAAVLALTRSRFGTYGICLMAAMATAFFLMRGYMTWAGNWVLMGNAQGSAIPWSDLGLFEIDRQAIVLNRLFVLALAALFGWIAGRYLLRRERDRMHPMVRPDERRRTLLTATALALPPVILCFALWALVNQGFEGAKTRHIQKDYWSKNLTSWTNQALPYLVHVDMDLGLDPDNRGIRVSGAYDLQNRKDEPLSWFPVTGGTTWTDLQWTLNGRPYKPEDRSRLYVFRLDKPLLKGETVRLGFRYKGTILPGVSRNGGELELGEFLLSSSAILTGRNPEFVPIVRYHPRIGVDPARNLVEPRIYPPRYYQGITDSDLDRSEFTQRLRITAPADYLVNSTGVMESEVVRGGKRTRVWVSDYPLRVFNIAAGRNWSVKRGRNTAVFYYAGHPWNVDNMAEALDGARKYYAEWYMPSPWREMRLNEFPAYANYARGNATNIFFSESSGFFSLRQPDNDGAFSVAAHEAAHQWWGHIVSPGDAPGGIVLAEGAANFATLMLLDQIRGPQTRQNLAMRLEANYGERRQPSTELPLNQTLERDGRLGDNTVVYDRGGWAFWMLYQRMGKEPFLKGVQEFFRIYHNNLDHPVIEDFVAVLRPYAADKAGFDDLVRQAFYETSTPEYRFEEKKKERVGEAWEVTLKVENAGTGRFPVEVAAARGERYDDKGKPSPEYQEVRTRIVLGPGESQVVRFRCPFEPERAVVDPDVQVLQLQRRAATVRL